MTSIAYKDGVVAADSRETWGDGAGCHVTTCEKLFRKRVAKRDVIIATAGGTYAGMVFVDWYGSSTPAPDILKSVDVEEDFEALVFDRGKIYHVNRLCRLVEARDPFIAIGSGAKAALAAMHCGRGAREAVRIATLIDPYSAPPVVTMTTPGASSSRARPGKNRRLPRGKPA